MSESRQPQTDWSQSSEFESFSTEVRAMVPGLAEQLSTDAHEVENTIETALAESAQTLRLLHRAGMDSSDRLLEVGAGLGLTSAFLARRGQVITSVEPSAVGFDWHATVAGELATRLETAHQHLTVTADAIPTEAGPFDLIFSNNVLEHISNLFESLDHLVTLLAAGGRMFHSCPNYSFPFEPHFGVPLLPFIPAHSSKVLPKSIVGTSLWASLNFVTARQVTDWAQERGVVVAFGEGQLASSVERLTTDVEFAKRHPALTKVAEGLDRVGVTGLLRRLPATWSTPMEFSIAAN